MTRTPDIGRSFVQGSGGFDLVTQDEVGAVARPRQGRVAPVFLAPGSMTLAIGSRATVLLSGDNPAGTSNFGQGVLIALIWIMIAASNISYARAQLTLLWRSCGAAATSCTVRT